MERRVFGFERVHESVRGAKVGFHNDLIDEVEQAVEKNDVVGVGMAKNTFVKRARKALDQKDVKYAYFEYGGYTSKWKQRLALKMWLGWPTIPMIFVRGLFVGGSTDLERLIADGSFDELLAKA